MLSEATTALAAMSGAALVQAVTQDGWAALRARATRALAPQDGDLAPRTAPADAAAEEAADGASEPEAARSAFPVAAIHANSHDGSRQINIAHLQGNPTFHL